MREKFDDTGPGASNDGLIFTDQNRALQELFVFHENLHHRLGIVDEVFGIQFEFLKFRVLADEIFYRVFEDLYDVFEGGLIGRVFEVEDDFVFDSEFPGDRQGIGRRASVVVMVDRDHGPRGSSAGGKMKREKCQGKGCTLF